jgi:putative oxidoreductase
MIRVATRLVDGAYLLLRVVSGLLFAEHGLQLTFGLLGGTRMPLFSLLGLAGVIELVAGLMVAFGVFPRWAAFLASGEMAFAYFIAHAPKGFWPVQNLGELSVLYCFIFLFIAARGGGKATLLGD